MANLVPFADIVGQMPFLSWDIWHFRFPPPRLLYMGEAMLMLSWR
jgi:hypothetical protein